MKKYIVALLAVFISGLTFAASNCPHLYPNNTPIEVPGTIELCSSFFVVRYDPAKKAAILASEVIQAKRVLVPRVDSFRPDERLSKNQRASNADYLKTGKDKGHLVPAGDAASPEQMRETFRLSNMTPQAPMLNRETWRELEYMVRGKVKRGGSDTWAVTGASYSDIVETIGKNKIPVPTGYYKIAYYVGGTKAFYAHNVNDAAVISTTVEDINHFTSLSLPN